MRTLVIWLVAVVATYLRAGCAAHDAADESPAGDHPARVTDDCAQQIDAQITAHIVPNADREYAEGMCRATR